jgi:hypothetical protein
MSHFIKPSKPVLGRQTETATTAKWSHVIPSSSPFSSCSFTTLSHRSSARGTSFFFFFSSSSSSVFPPLVFCISNSSSHFRISPFSARCVLSIIYSFILIGYRAFFVVFISSGEILIANSN